MQALVTALGVSWEEASHLLKHTQGDLTAAFKNELSAYHLDEQLLDDLVWEYAACRFVPVGCAMLRCAALRCAALRCAVLCSRARQDLLDHEHVGSSA